MKKSLFMYVGSSSKLVIGSWVDAIANKIIIGEFICSWTIAVYLKEDSTK